MLPNMSAAQFKTMVQQIVRDEMSRAIQAGRLNDGLRLFLADKNHNNTYDALTAAAWEAGSPAASGTINWAGVFGLPGRATAVLLWVSGTISFKATSGTTNPSSTTGEFRFVPVYIDGTSAWFSASGTVTVRVLAWFA